MRVRHCLLASVAILVAAATGRTDSVLRNRPGLPLQPEAVEIRLTDGSGLFLSLLEEQIDVTTPYGKLRIKLRSVMKIEFGIRIPAELGQKIDAAVASMDSGEDKRVEAWKALAEAKEYAYPALLQLAHHRDKAVVTKAAEMATKLKASMPAARLNKIDRDVIHTDTSRIVGRIETTEFKVVTPHFGPLSLKLSDLAMMRQGDGAESEDALGPILPDPGQLTAYQNRIGQSFYFRVTGAIDDLWGTDTYTTDSSLAAAAVHAGVVKLGQTGVVKVTITQGLNSYTGSTRNGVSSAFYGNFPGSFKVSAVKKKKEE